MITNGHLGELKTAFKYAAGYLDELVWGGSFINNRVNSAWDIINIRGRYFPHSTLSGR